MPPMTITPATIARSRVLRWLARQGLRLSGWRLEGELPPASRYVAIGAPHTSNWDFMLMLAVVLEYGLEFVWMGKNTLFRGPTAALFRWLGGIPIDRSRPGGMVEQAIAAFDERRHLVMVITPEGTRKQVARWKRGFYHVARGAGVPILLAYVDHGRKVAGLGPLFTPTDDVEADMAAIQAFYAPYLPAQRDSR